MRRQMVAAIAGIGLLLLALVLAGRGAAPVAAEPLPPLATPRTAHLAFTLAMRGGDTATGETFDFSARGEGDVDAARRALRLAYELRLPPDLATPGTPTPERVAVEVVQVDGRLYLRDPLTGQWSWLALPAGGEELQFVPNAATWGELTGGAAPAFARVGPEQVAGAATTHWRVATDLAGLLSADPGVAATPAVGAMPTMALTVDLWIGDADRYLHRATLALDFAAEGDGASASFGLTMTLAYSKFDEPVSIVAPDGAVPAAAGTEPSGGLFPSLSSLPLNGTSFALPGGGGTIAGAFPSVGGVTIGRPGGSPAPGNGRGGIRIAPAEPTKAARPSPTPTRPAAPTPTAPRPTATTAVAAVAALPPTAAAQQAAVAPAARPAPQPAPQPRADNRLLILGTAGLVVLLGLSGTLIAVGRRRG